MAKWLNWLLGRGEARARAERDPAAVLTAPVSVAEDSSRWNRALEQFLPLPNATPFEMLHVYRMLRDAIPDISDAIWTWKRLCQTGYDVELVNASSEVAERRARRLIDGLNQRVNSGDRGMDGLLDILYGSLFTYGAAACDIVLTESRESIHDVVPVDVWTVRFKREEAGLQPFQVVDGEEIRLPAERFIYLAMDRDGTNPYGRSMLRTLPFAVKVQQRLMEDMAKATRNAGWSKLHIQYAPGDALRGESAENYRKRVEGTMEDVRTQMTGTQADQNLITLDNVKVNVLRGDGKGQGFYDNHKAVEEQIITGTHLMPILLGRNYGTTETYGTAQFEIINRQVESLNRQVKRMLEQLYNFELALMWGEATARVHMRQNRTVDPLKAAQARQQEIENALRLKGEGLLDAEDVARVLNL